MAKKIHKLEDIIKPDFQLIGISSYENDYRVCWDLNNLLAINLSRITSLKSLNKKTKEQMEFSVFTYFDEENYVRFNLINNRCHEGFLIESQKRTDYFLQIISELKTNLLNETLSKLRKSSLLQAVYIIDVESLKTWNKLIF